MKLTPTEYEVRRICHSLDGSHPAAIKGAIKAWLASSSEAPYITECAVYDMARKPEWNSLRITDRMAWADQLNTEINRRLADKADELYESEMCEEAA